MKRILTFFTLILVFICLAYSYSSSNEPNTLIIVPFNAVSGIPVGSNYYKSDESGKWQGGSPVSTKGVNYTNVEMIGIIMFMNASGSGNESQVDMNGNITVTVTCPNGFYLQSQSNPNYKVPFEIMLFDFWNSEGSRGHKISEEEPTINVSITNQMNGGDAGGGGNWQFHFDVVIRLPGTVDTTTNECTKDGVIYPLAVLDDYSAVVTISVKYECTTFGKTNVLEKTVTVPFGGYYDGQKNPAAKEDTVSMNIVLNSEASNIDIQNKLGKTINIGSMYYAMMVGKDYTSGATTSLNSAIFLSSSSDPYDTSATKFALVKDDVGATEALTSLNSVGFKLKVTSYEDGKTRTFDGTTYFPTSGFTPSGNISVASGYPGNRKKSTQELKSDEFIIPDMYAEYMATGNQVYFSYSGSIELELDDNVVTMQSGRYIETVYVHVMAYK